MVLYIIVLLIIGLIAGAVARLLVPGRDPYRPSERQQQRILARVSDALGRRVDVGQIKAQMGFGVSIEVSGLKIADDAAFSEKPFLSANEVSVEVEFVPLLYGDAKVTRLELINPDIRIVRNARGDLAPAHPANAGRRRARVEAYWDGLLTVM